MRLRDETEVRRATSLLINLLSEIGGTSLLITEISGFHAYSRFGFEEHVADGVIVLRLTPHYGELKRYVRILKMRGTNHGMENYPFEITPKGIVVHCR